MLTKVLQKVTLCFLKNYKIERVSECLKKLIRYLLSGAYLYKKKSENRVGKNNKNIREEKYTF